MANEFNPYSLPNYGSLEREFQGIYGPEQDFRRFLTDKAYRNSLPVPRGKGPMGAINFVGDIGFYARDDVQSLASTLSGIEGFKPIDIGPMFDPLRAEVGKLSEQSLATQRTRIAGAAEGAQERATEGLAGTGLGRSGVAAEQFQGIETRRQDLLAGAEAQVEQKRLETLFGLSLQQANLEYSEQLRASGFTQDMVKDAIGFDRLLMQMQFAQELQGDDSSWFADFVEIANGVTSVVSGWQSAFAGGGSIASAGG